MSSNTYKANPRDRDKDGLLQEGTDFERPAKINGKSQVAIYSTKNIYWEGMGRIHTGYNLVGPVSAGQWITQDGVRIATPEEVAKEFGQ